MNVTKYVICVVLVIFIVGELGVVFVVVGGGLFFVCVEVFVYCLVVLLGCVVG